MTDNNLDSRFLDAVRAAFARSIDEGRLRISSSEYDPDAFGNSVVVLSGNNLKIRLVRDRGDVLADATDRNEEVKWVPIEHMLQAVGAGPRVPLRVISLTEVAELVEAHLDALEAGLSSARRAETWKTVDRLAKEALDRIRERERPG